MSGSEGGGFAVSLNRNHLPRVDAAEDRLRERQHCPWREEFLFVPRFVRLPVPRRGLLEVTRLGIVSAAGFLRKVVRRLVRTVLARAHYKRGGAQHSDHDEELHRAIRWMDFSRGKNCPRGAG